jgi:integrase
MNNFTVKIEPQLYPSKENGYKDKNGRAITKWFIAYTLSFDHGNGKRVFVRRKEYGKSYGVTLNGKQDIKTKVYEAKVLIEWIKSDLAKGIDPENREVENEIAIQNELKMAEKYNYRMLFTHWFTKKNYINPIPSKVESARVLKNFHLNQFLPYLVSIGKDVDIRTISDTDINNYILGQYNSGKWSAFTCDNKIGWLNGIFKFAVVHKLIESNPMNNVPKIKEDKVIFVNGELVLKQRKETRFNIFTDYEMKVILEELKETPYRTVSQVIYYAFIRTSEIFRLRLGDLDLTTDCFNIRSNIAKSQRDGTTMKVKIYPALKTFLLQYVEDYFGDDRNPDYFLFYHQTKDQMTTYSSYQHHFNAAKERLKAKGIVINKTPYAFKHTGAKKFIDTNKQKNFTSYQIIEQIMQQMRHSDFTTSQKYIYKDLGIELDQAGDFSFE